MAQRRRTNPDVVLRIRELTWAGHTGPSIERLLSADPQYADSAPSLRTIQSIMRETEAKPDEWWSVAESSPQEARLVLPVLAAQIRRRAELEQVYFAKHGRRLSPLPAGALRLHRELAGWIAKLRTIEPEIPVNDAYSLAIRYWFGATPYLDAYLALHAWQPGAHARAVRDHLLPASGLGGTEG